MLRDSENTTVSPPSTAEPLFHDSDKVEPWISKVTISPRDDLNESSTDNSRHLRLNASTITRSRNSPTSPPACVAQNGGRASVSAPHDSAPSGESNSSPRCGPSNETNSPQSTRRRSRPPKTTTLQPSSLRLPQQRRKRSGRKVQRRPVQCQASDVVIRHDSAACSHQLVLDSTSSSPSVSKPRPSRTKSRRKKTRSLLRSESPSNSTLVTTISLHLHADDASSELEAKRGESNHHQHQQQQPNVSEIQLTISPTTTTPSLDPEEQEHSEEDQEDLFPSSDPAIDLHQVVTTRFGRRCSVSFARAREQVSEEVSPEIILDHSWNRCRRSVNSKNRNKQNKNTNDKNDSVRLIDRRRRIKKCIERLSTPTLGSSSSDPNLKLLRPSTTFEGSRHRIRIRRRRRTRRSVDEMNDPLPTLTPFAFECAMREDYGSAPLDLDLEPAVDVGVVDSSPQEEEEGRKKNKMRLYTAERGASGRFLLPRKKQKRRTKRRRRAATALPGTRSRFETTTTESEEEEGEEEDSDSSSSFELPPTNTAVTTTTTTTTTETESTSVSSLIANSPKVNRNGRRRGGATRALECLFMLPAKTEIPEKFHVSETLPILTRSTRKIYFERDVFPSLYPVTRNDAQELLALYRRLSDRVSRKQIELSRLRKKARDAFLSKCREDAISRGPTARSGRRQPKVALAVPPPVIHDEDWMDHCSELWAVVETVVKELLRQMRTKCSERAELVEQMMMDLRDVQSRAMTHGRRSRKRLKEKHDLLMNLRRHLDNLSSFVFLRQRQNMLYRTKIAQMEKQIASLTLHNESLRQDLRGEVRRNTLLIKSQKAEMVRSSAAALHALGALKYNKGVQTLETALGAGRGRGTPLEEEMAANATSGLLEDERRAMVKRRREQREARKAIRLKRSLMKTEAVQATPEVEDYGVGTVEKVVRNSVAQVAVEVEHEMVQVQPTRRHAFVQTGARRTAEIAIQTSSSVVGSRSGRSRPPMTPQTPSDSRPHSRVSTDRIRSRTVISRQENRRGAMNQLEQQQQQPRRRRRSPGIPPDAPPRDLEEMPTRRRAWLREDPNCYSSSSSSSTASLLEPIQPKTFRPKIQRQRGRGGGGREEEEGEVSSGGSKKLLVVMPSLSQDSPPFTPWSEDNSPRHLNGGEERQGGKRGPPSRKKKKTRTRRRTHRKQSSVAAAEEEHSDSSSSSSSSSPRISRLQQHQRRRRGRRRGPTSSGPQIIPRRTNTTTTTTRRIHLLLDDDEEEDETHHCQNQNEIDPYAMINDDNPPTPISFVVSPLAKFDLRSILNGRKKPRAMTQKTVLRNILEVFSELAKSGFVQSVTESLDLHRFLLDCYVRRFGLPKLARDNLSDLLKNLIEFRDHSRVVLFVNYFSLHPIVKFSVRTNLAFNLSTLEPFLRAIQCARTILNRRSVKLLEEGVLMVPKEFILTILHRLNLHFTVEENDYLLAQLSSSVEAVVSSSSVLDSSSAITSTRLLEFDQSLGILMMTLNLHEKNKVLQNPGGGGGEHPPHRYDVEEEEKGEEGISAAATGSDGDVVVGNDDDDDDSNGSNSIIITADILRRMTKGFFGKIYRFGDEESLSQVQVQRNENLVLRDILDAYLRSQRRIFDVINRQVSDVTVQKNYFEMYSTLVSKIAYEVEAEKAIEYYRLFVYNLLKESSSRVHHAFAEFLLRFE